jgi:long-chain acyl-CoA synthetase
MATKQKNTKSTKDAQKNSVQSKKSLTLCSGIPLISQRDHKKIAIKYKKNQKWVDTTWASYLEKIQTAHWALRSFGIDKGDSVGIISNSRYEWSICDWAILSSGAVTIPLYPNISIEDFEYIVNHSKIKVLFIENKVLLKQWLTIKAKCKQVQYVISFDIQESDVENGIFSFNSFLSKGIPLTQEKQNKFNQICNQIATEDTATVIYTSGTTGLPKGVELTHENIFTATKGAFQTLGVSDKDVTLSILPYSHVLGRIEHFGHLYVGFTMAYAENIEHIRSYLKDINPTILLGVPRIFEKIYTSIKTKIQTNFIQKEVFNKACQIGFEVSRLQQRHEAVDIALFLQYQICRKLVFDKLKNDIFGTQLKFAVCGGAPLSKEVAEFFHAMGILLLEGYGLTETAGPICVNRTYDFEFGSVGKPLEDVEVKIADDGEILIKSPSVMKSYFKDKEGTAESFTDGWFHTGDIGEINASGRIKIKDRKKDLIKTANGKYVAPQKLENLLKQFPFISHTHIHGDEKKYIIALITLNKNYIFNFAKEKELSFNSLEDLKDHPTIIDLVRKGVANINQNLASHESIKKFALLSQDFSIENGELTPSLKVKRKVVDEKYKVLIDSLYF